MAKPTGKVIKVREQHERAVNRLKESLELGYDTFGEGLTFREMEDNVRYLYLKAKIEEGENNNG